LLRLVREPAGNASQGMTMIAARLLAIVGSTNGVKRS
jgi:hypothetical protein